MNIQAMQARKEQLIAEHARISQMVEQGRKTLGMLEGAVQEINHWIQQAVPPLPEQDLEANNVIKLEDRKPRFRKTFKPDGTTVEETSADAPDNTPSS